MSSVARQTRVTFLALPPAKVVSMLLPPTRCVLVVDDNQDSADSFGVLVRLWGYEPVIAYNTQSAQELASIYRPKAVLLNLGLPAENGLELARRLRQRPELQTTALIAVSGYSNEDIRR